MDGKEILRDMDDIIDDLRRLQRDAQKARDAFDDYNEEQGREIDSLKDQLKDLERQVGR